ncbi:hypothetical protein ACR3K2_04500 [Cryptosporidium serpentis]
MEKINFLSRIYICYQNIYYNLLSSFIYGHRYIKNTPVPRYTKKDVFIICFCIVCWLCISLFIPLCGIILTFAISPNMIDLVPAINSSDYFTISNPLTKATVTNNLVGFKSSFSFLLDISRVDYLFLSEVEVNSADIAYLGPVPVDAATGKILCNTRTMPYLFTDITVLDYIPIPKSMIDFSCTEDYKSCIIGFTISPYLLIPSYTEESLKNDLVAGHSNFVIKIHFVNSKLPRNFISRDLGFRYMKFSLPIQTK